MFNNGIATKAPPRTTMQHLNAKANKLTQPLRKFASATQRAVTMINQHISAQQKSELIYKLHNTQNERIKEAIALS